MITIYDFKADYQNEKAAKVRRSTNADGKSLNEENLEKINWEPLDQDIHDESGSLPKLQTGLGCETMDI